MSGDPSPWTMRSLEALLSGGVVGTRDDRALLDLFRSRRDPVGAEAFRVLLERHGPMVMGICRSYLADSSDADDAFQATFLVLVRKAAEIRNVESLGPWLRAVALRIARRARADAARRSRRERHLGADALLVADPGGRGIPGLGEALHEELDALPERDRLPIVWCCLEGLSYAQAARLAGVTEAALRGRLHRARGKLEGRLKRRGFTLSPAEGPSTILASTGLRVPPPAALSDAMVLMAEQVLAGRGLPISAAPLVEGGLAMPWNRMTAWIIPAAASACLVGGVVLAQRSGREVGGGDLKTLASPAQIDAPRATPADPETRDREILRKLDLKADFHFDGPVSLSDFLKHVKRVSVEGGDSGIPIYVHPSALEEVKVNITDIRRLELRTHPIKVALQQYLSNYSLSYLVKDGYLLIDSRTSVLDQRLERVERKLDRLIDKLLPPR